jgi:hypothetical protein
MRLLFSSSVFFRVVALVILSQVWFNIILKIVYLCKFGIDQAEGQCSEKKRAITSKEHFDKIKQHIDSVREQLEMLKGALEELGCQQRKTSNLNEKSKIKPYVLYLIDMCWSFDVIQLKLIQVSRGKVHPEVLTPL